MLQQAGADKSLALPGRKQTRKHVRNARDFNKLEKQAVIMFTFLQGKAPKEIRAILTETLACFFPGRAKNLSAPLYSLPLTVTANICLRNANIFAISHAISKTPNINISYIFYFLISTNLMR